MRANLFPILLFFGINGMTEGTPLPYYGRECNITDKSSCPHGKICAIRNDPFSRTQYVCVDGEKCRGSVNGQCKGGQVCRLDAYEFLACENVPCSLKSDGTCLWSDEVCTPHEHTSGTVTYSCELKKGRCSTDDPRSCPKGQVCEVKGNGSKGLCEEAHCGKPANGICPKGKVCESEKPNAKGPYSCVKEVPCGRKTKGQCPGAFEECKGRGAGENKTYFCEIIYCGQTMGKCFLGICTKHPFDNGFFCK